MLNFLKQNGITIKWEIYVSNHVKQPKEIGRPEGWGGPDFRKLKKHLGKLS